MFISTKSKQYSLNIIAGCKQHVEELIAAGYTCYFITHTFNDTNSHRKRTFRVSSVLTNLPPSRIWSDYARFFKWTCSALIGRNWARKRPLQPIVYAFLDVACPIEVIRVEC